MGPNWAKDGIWVYWRTPVRGLEPGLTLERDPGSPRLLPAPPLASDWAQLPTIISLAADFKDAGLREQAGQRLKPGKASV